MKEQHIEFEQAESQKLSFYRHGDGNNSVQVMGEYYSLKEAYQNQTADTQTTYIDKSEPDTQDDHAILHQVFNFKRKNKNNILQKLGSLFRPNPDEFKELDNIIHQTNNIQDENDRLDAITELSMYADEMVDKVENQCIYKAAFFTLMFSFAWFLPLVSHVMLIHADHHFLWNFLPPVTALSLIISIALGLGGGGKYFARKSLRLKKYSAYAKMLDQALLANIRI